MDPEEILPDPGMTPEEYVDKLILAGVVEVAGIDTDSGDFVYGFTDKLEALTSGIKDRLDQMFFEDVQVLWEKGFLNMDITKPNPVVTLAERAMIEKEREDLPPNLKQTLNYIINALKI